jgi:hypothetical protein
LEPQYGPPSRDKKQRIGMLEAELDCTCTIERPVENVAQKGAISHQESFPMVLNIIFYHNCSRIKMHLWDIHD